MLYPRQFFSFNLASTSCVTITKGTFSTILWHITHRYFFSKWCNYITKWWCRTRILLDVTLYFLQQRFYSTAESLRAFYSVFWSVWFSRLWIRVSTYFGAFLIVSRHYIHIGTREEMTRKIVKVNVVLCWDGRRKLILFCWEVVTVGDCLELQ
jgi:hypothetical protein